MAANALELARHGTPKAPFYLTGQVGGQPFSVHAEGERVILTRADGQQEIRLERELARQQALARMAQRTIGLAMPPAPAKPAASSTAKPTGKSTGKKRRRPKVARALSVAAHLQNNDTDGTIPAAMPEAKTV